MAFCSVFARLLIDLGWIWERFGRVFGRFFGPKMHARSETKKNFYKIANPEQHRKNLGFCCRSPQACESCFFRKNASVAASKAQNRLKNKKSLQNATSNDKNETKRKNVEKLPPGAPFGRGLGGSWAPLGRSWAPLGRLLGTLGRLLGALGRLLAGLFDSISPKLVQDALQEAFWIDFGSIWGWFWEDLGRVWARI